VITRRACVASLAGMALSAAPGGLSPLDEQAFRQMAASHRGKVLLVDFWATWCAPCRDELPKLVALYSTYKSKGLVLAAISCDEAEQETQAAAFVTKQAAPLPHYIRRAKDDDQFINAVDPKWSGALPALFLFDRNGRQALSFIGETNMTKLDDAIRRLLAA